jgi:signal transduction histidine kinase
MSGGPESSERLAIVAHELRSPVAALAALADAAPTVPPAARPRVVALAVAAGRDVERILGDPALFSLRLETVDVRHLVSALAADAVVVRCEGRPTVEGDPTRLRQAIANLVANGLRHGTHVTIDVRASDGRVAVDVADDGPGLDPGLDPFAPGTSGVGSSGLGLWLARAIAEAHGGTLQPVPGDAPGARLRLSLPSASGAG